LNLRLRLCNCNWLTNRLRNIFSLFINVELGFGLFVLYFYLFYWAFPFSLGHIFFWSIRIVDLSWFFLNDFGCVRIINRLFYCIGLLLWFCLWNRILNIIIFFCWFYVCLKRRLIGLVVTLQVIVY